LPPGARDELKRTVDPDRVREACSELPNVDMLAFVTWLKSARGGGSLQEPQATCPHMAALDDDEKGAHSQSIAQVFAPSDTPCPDGCFSDTATFLCIHCVTPTLPSGASFQQCCKQPGHILHVSVCRGDVRMWCSACDGFVRPGRCKGHVDAVRAVVAT